MIKVQKREFLFIPPLLNQEKILIIRLHYIASRCLLNLLMPDIPDIHFFSKSAVDPKHCLLPVGLFTYKVYTMKSRNLLPKKIELFYRDIQQKREQIAENTTMRLQTDLEFSQNEI